MLTLGFHGLWGSVTARHGQGSRVQLKLGLLELQLHQSLQKARLEASCICIVEQRQRRDVASERDASHIPPFWAVSYRRKCAGTP